MAGQSGERGQKGENGQQGNLKYLKKHPQCLNLLKTLFKVLTAQSALEENQ